MIGRGVPAHLWDLLAVDSEAFNGRPRDEIGRVMVTYSIASGAAWAKTRPSSARTLHVELLIVDVAIGQCKHAR